MSSLGAMPSTVGRYVLHAEIATGGMATVYIGRLTGPMGFARTVAIKRLHPQLARDPEFAAMFLDEARLAARIQHPNVVSIIDVVAVDGELLLVMGYLPGESLARLLGRQRSRSDRLEARIAVKIMADVLSGLHAAHDARSERGRALDLVHRDVSPQNILVGSDGVAHLIDFGVAKAAGRIQHTKDGQLKGKLAYMPPEQIQQGTVDRRTDIYAAGAVLWEALAGRRLFVGDESNLVFAVLNAPVSPPGAHVPGLPPAVDAVVMRALSRDRRQRFQTALEMADALEAALPPASAREVARWVERVAADTLARQAELVEHAESCADEPASRERPASPDGSASLPSPPASGARPAAAPDGCAEMPTDTTTTVSRVRSAPALGAGLRSWVQVAVAATAAAALTGIVVSKCARPPAEPILTAPATRERQPVGRGGREATSAGPDAPSGSAGSPAAPSRSAPETGPGAATGSAATSKPTAPPPGPRAGDWARRVDRQKKYGW